jgi:hypothetical protein
VTRARKQRREKERALRKNVRAIERAAVASPGGAPDHPIVVPSASVVEPRARATACVQCGGDLDLGGDRATSTPRGVLREIQVVCRRCHAPRSLWFLVAPTGHN